jgi:hypothetical protein
VNDLKRAREMLCREIEAKYEEDEYEVDDSDTELRSLYKAFLLLASNRSPLMLVEQ